MGVKFAGLEMHRCKKLTNIKCLQPLAKFLKWTLKVQKVDITLSYISKNNEKEDELNCDFQGYGKEPLQQSHFVPNTFEGR